MARNIIPGKANLNDKQRKELERKAKRLAKAEKKKKK